MKLPKNVTAFRDRHGKIRYRFRRVGLPVRSLPGAPDSAEFEQALAEARAGIPAPQRPRREPKQPRIGQVVYFVGCGDTVKIGTSANLPHRLAAIATGTHEVVELLAAIPGGTVLERTFHKRFSHAHIRREWFKRTSEIEAEIATLATHGAGR